MHKLLQLIFGVFSLFIYLFAELRFISVSNGVQQHAVKNDHCDLTKRKAFFLIFPKCFCYCFDITSSAQVGSLGVLEYL